TRRRVSRTGRGCGRGGRGGRFVGDVGFVVVECLLVAGRRSLRGLGAPPRGHGSLPRWSGGSARLARRARMAGVVTRHRAQRPPGGPRGGAPRARGANAFTG